MSQFALCFEAHRPDGLVWALKHPVSDVDNDESWTLYRAVDVYVPIASVYRGQQANQPKAYFTGVASDIQVQGHHAVIR